LRELAENLQKVANIAQAVATACFLCLHKVHRYTLSHCRIICKGGKKMSNGFFSAFQGASKKEESKANDSSKKWKKQKKYNKKTGKKLNKLDKKITTVERQTACISENVKKINRNLNSVYQQLQKPQEIHVYQEFQKKAGKVDGNA
jgi:septal ring factor EnvC (AmiA/AmiB activator)